MKNISIKVYQASELTPEALERAKNQYLQNWPYPWYDEGENVLQIIESAFNFSYFRWNVDGSKWWYYFNIPEEVADLTGHKAAEWIKGILCGITDESAEFFKNSQYYLDYSFLMPVNDFLEDPDARTVYDVVDDGLEAFFKVQSANVAYYETDEAFTENSEANDWFYFQNGDFYSETKHGATEEPEPLHLTNI